MDNFELFFVTRILKLYMKITQIKNLQIKLGRYDIIVNVNYCNVMQIIQKYIMIK